jgi:hypothetical protein
VESALFIHHLRDTSTLSIAAGFQRNPPRLRGARLPPRSRLHRLDKELAEIEISETRRATSSLEQKPISVRGEPECTPAG